MAMSRDRANAAAEDGDSRGTDEGIPKISAAYSFTSSLCDLLPLPAAEACAKGRAFMASAKMTAITRSYLDSVTMVR